MNLFSKTLIVSGLLGIASTAIAAEQTKTVAKETYACVSWAAWHDYSQASLTAKGARASKLCPIRIAAKSKVILVEDDAGEGASQVSYQGKDWYVDADALK